jgi:hypothetical protein
MGVKPCVIGIAIMQDNECLAGCEESSLFLDARHL